MRTTCARMASRQNGTMLQWALAALKNDREIMMEAIKQCYTDRKTERVINVPNTNADVLAIERVRTRRLITSGGGSTYTTAGGLRVEGSARWTARGARSRAQQPSCRRGTTRKRTTISAPSRSR